MLEVAIALAGEDGLARITARRIASRSGVAQGLVTHYFGTIDALMAAAFERVAERDRPDWGGQAATEPLEQLRVLLSYSLSRERDPEALLWLDAWRESAHRPALREAVVRQMEMDIQELDAIVRRGKEMGQFPRASSESAMRILALIDGLAANAAVRASLQDSLLNYENAIEFVYAVIEQELGVSAGTLGPHAT